MASPVSAGDIVGELTRVETVKQTAAAITQGDLAQGTTTGFRQCPATINQLGPWGVCFKTTTSSNTTVDLVTTGEVYMTLDGTVNAHQYVTNASGTAGRVIQWVARSDYTNDTAGIKLAGQEPQRLVGIYMGHVDEGPGTVPTDGAQNDIARIKLID